MSGSASLADIVPAEALGQAEGGTRMATLAAAAEAVVHPASTDEVAEVLRWATANDVGVLPVGSAGRVSARSREGRFVVLTTDRLTGFEIYEPADLTLTAKAGTRLSEIEGALAPHGQWLPFDPPGVGRRTLGGLVATGESGPVAAGYGDLRSHVLGATVVCGDGRTLRLGGRVVKNVAGFDLLRPLVSSRGRLGVITSVCVRAFPIPSVDRLLVWRATSLRDLEPVARSIRTAPVLPVSSVFGVSASTQGMEAVLAVRLHGADSAVHADQATLERCAGVSFERVTDRANLEGALNAGSDFAVTVRLSVLASKLFEALDLAREHLGAATIVADAYSGAARLGVDQADANSLRLLQREIESFGGSLALDANEAAPDLDGVGSLPSEAERELGGRLERVFDPGEVFWPCRL